jgi:hypothetical protein
MQEAADLNKIPATREDSIVFLVIGLIFSTSWRGCSPVARSRDGQESVPKRLAFLTSSGDHHLPDLR